MAELFQAQAIETCACQTQKCLARLAVKYGERLGDVERRPGDEEEFLDAARRIADCQGALSAKDPPPMIAAPAAGGALANAAEATGVPAAE
jgi:hypothetical protein